MTNPIIIRNHPLRHRTPNILNQTTKIRMITQSNQMLPLTNLPTRRTKLPTTNTNPRTTQTHPLPSIHMIKRNTRQILIQQVPTLLRRGKRQTTKLHPMRLTNLRNIKHPLRHNKRHTNIRPTKNLHNLLQLTIIAKNVNRAQPKILFNHGNKQLPNIHLKRAFKPWASVSRLNNKRITTQQRLSTVNPEVTSIPHPPALRILHQNLSRTQNVVRLKKRHPLVAILKRFPVLQKLHRTRIKRQRTIHNPDKVTSSPSHQNLVTTLQTPPQTNQMIRMSMSNHTQRPIRVKRVTSHRITQQNRTPLTHSSLLRHTNTPQTKCSSTPANQQAAAAQHTQ
jgi:hypothetical protein